MLLLGVISSLWSYSVVTGLGTAATAIKHAFVMRAEYEKLLFAAHMRIRLWRPGHPDEGEPRAPRLRVGVGVELPLGGVVFSLKEKKTTVSGICASAIIN